MIHRERLKWPEHIYPADEWRLVEKQFNPGYLGQMETFFALANGYQYLKPGWGANRLENAANSFIGRKFYRIHNFEYIIRHIQNYEYDKSQIIFGR